MIDENDNPPEFSVNTLVSLSISENAPVGSTYSLGAVTDADRGLNGAIDVRIIQGNENEGKNESNCCHVK